MPAARSALLMSWYSGDQIKKNETDWLVACMEWEGGGGQESYMQCLVGRHEVQGPLGRPKNGLQHNIQVNLSMDRDRWRTAVTVVLNIWLSENVRDFLTS